VTLATAPLVVMLVGVVAYAVLGGADFGAGFWQMIPGDDEQRRAVRGHARNAITPVWEANHVWLIFVLVICWTCYPAVYGSIASTLALPLAIAGLGIVLRAIGYVVRGQSRGGRIERPVEILFGAASVIVPFALGAVVGAIASGRVPPGNARGDLVTSWVNPTSVAVGVLSVVSAAYLAAVWLAADAYRQGDSEVESSFRTLAMGTAAVAGVVAVAGLVTVRYDDERLWHNLIRWPAVAAVALSAAAGLVAIGCLATRRLEAARIASTAAVAAVIAGWGLAQRPEMLPGVTVTEAAAGRETLVAVLAGLAAGALILVPSLFVLFRMVLRGRFDPSAAPYPAALPAYSPVLEPGRVVFVCAAGAVAGGLTLFFFSSGWTNAIGVSLMLVFGALGFWVAARSLVAAER
jgi:cytochrome bd ubiquinol oxidase subunit II